MFATARLRLLTICVVILAASTSQTIAQTATNTWSTQTIPSTISNQLDDAIYGGPGNVHEPGLIGNRFGVPTPADPLPGDKDRVPFNNVHLVPDNGTGNAPKASKSPIPESESAMMPNLTVGSGGYPIIDIGSGSNDDNCSSVPTTTISGGCVETAPPIVLPSWCPTFCAAPICSMNERFCLVRDSAKGFICDFGMGNCACHGGCNACIRSCISGLTGQPCCQCPMSQRVYGSVGYLGWWTRGMRIPTVATTSPLGTPIDRAGVLNWPNTTNLWGPGRLDANAHSGLRVSLGVNFDCCGCRGLVADYFYLGGQGDGFYARAPEDYEILARPFYNSFTGEDDASIVGYPNFADGTLVASTVTDFQGGGIMFRQNMLCYPPSCCVPCDPCADPCEDPCESSVTDRITGWVSGICSPLSSVMPSFGCGCLTPTRADWLVGFRTYELDEALAINEFRTSIDPMGAVPVGTTFDTVDIFRTENRFYGLSFGADNEWIAGGRWGFGSRLRLSMGELQRRAVIRGSTTVTNPGVNPTTNNGGLLALPTNSGFYKNSRFIFSPEIGVNAFCMLSPCLRLNVGYTLVYVPNVWRPGDIVDTTLDPRLLPPATVATAGNPQFVPRDDDFWAQGINVGLEYRY